MATTHTTSAYSLPFAAAASGQRMHLYIGYYNLILGLFVRMIHLYFHFAFSDLHLGYSF